MKIDPFPALNCRFGAVLGLMTMALALLLGASIPAGAGAQGAGPFSIGGLVWQDDNANGRRDAGEMGIAGAEVRLGAQGQDPRLPARTKTDAGGRYVFAGLEAGRYQVQMTSAGLWLRTFPTRDPVGENFFVYSGSVSLATDVGSLDVGLFPAAGLPGFRGSLWVDGRRAFGSDVRALVNGVDCTAQPGFERGIVPSDGRSDYAIKVAPDVLVPGCGRDGDTISFLVDGRPANETAVWRRATTAQLPPGTIVSPTFPETVDAVFAGTSRLMLTVGPPIAVYGPDLVDADSGRDLVSVIHRLPVVQAFIDGRLCGSIVWTLLGDFWLVVPSEQLASGCGREGASVSFTVDGVPAKEQVAWRAAGEGQRLTLTVSASLLAGKASVRPPETGDGGLAQSPASASARPASR